jgi:lipopolysaccharide export system protein LptC
MKNQGSALFPLSLLAVLTLLTFWLRYVTQPDEPNRDGRYRHDPDYILSDTVMRKLDRNGQLRYILHAADVRHYPDNDVTDLDKPSLVQRNDRDGKPPVTISADHGQLSRGNERVDLRDNVRIHRPPSGEHEELTVITETLTIFPDEETAFTRSPVLITQGKSWVKGVGMQVDNRAQTYVIESRAVGSLENKRTEKRRS